MCLWWLYKPMMGLCYACTSHILMYSNSSLYFSFTLSKLHVVIKCNLAAVPKTIILSNLHLFYSSIEEPWGRYKHWNELLD